MTEIDTIGLDIAKQVFQAHGADASGHVIFRKKIVRAKLIAFFSSQPRCVVAMEACGGAHYWGREIGKLGHTVRLIPPAYVKPFLKRQKNDAADAEAICEAAQRPSMRFVAVKDEAQQASGVVFRARDVLVRQQTQCINALRGHLMEYGYVVSKGPVHIATLIDQVEDPNSQLPESARTIFMVLIATLGGGILALALKGTAAFGIRTGTGFLPGPTPGRQTSDPCTPSRQQGRSPRPVRPRCRRPLLRIAVRRRAAGPYGHAARAHW